MSSSVLLDSFQKKFEDPHYLPTYEEVSVYFGKNPQGAYEFWSHCMLGTRFELLTKEYIRNLATYLLGRLSDLQKDGISHPLILEIAAGDGRLSYFLGEELRHYNFEPFSIIATDDQSWQQPINIPFPVTKLPYLEALQLHSPNIVICSWMPQGEDFTAAIRKSPSVNEYILISDPNVCGHPWKTWGDSELWEAWLEDHGNWFQYYTHQAIKRFSLPPFQRDGYVRKTILADTTQLCRTDRYSNGKWTRNSWTESFTLQKKAST